MCPLKKANSDGPGEDTTSPLGGQANGLNPAAPKIRLVVLLFSSISKATSNLGSSTLPGVTDTCADPGGMVVHSQPVASNLR